MAAPTRITFGTANLLNLNLPGASIYRDRDGWDDEIYERKLDWTGRMLATADADVWGFQELWDRRALRALSNSAGFGRGYELLAPTNAKGQRIVNAGAVRKGLLVDPPEWITAFPEGFVLSSDGGVRDSGKLDVRINAFSRPVLRFSVRPRPTDRPIVVFVAHFKSRRPTRIDGDDWYDADVHKVHATALGAALATIRRTAEAAALRWLLTETMKGTETPVVVLGDLNDGQHSNTLNILTEQPGYLFGDRRGGTDNGLYTVQSLQEYRSLRDVYYTHVYEGKRESLDHVLVSEQFYDHSRRRLWTFEDMAVYNDHLNRDDHAISGTTDHGIVTASFRYGPAPKRVPRRRPPA